MSSYPHPSSSTRGGPDGRSVPGFNRYEQQVWRSAHPDPAETDLDAADEIQVLDEYLAIVESSVTIGVLENDDAVLSLVTLGSRGIGVRFGDPEAPAIVEREADGPRDVRFGGGELHGEAFGQAHRPCGFFARQAAVQNRIDGRQRRRFLGGDLGGEKRPRLMKAEVVEIDVRPGMLFDVDRGRRSRFLVDEPDEDLFSGVSLQIDHHRAEQRPIRAGDRVDRRVFVGQDELDPRAGERSAGHQEAGVGLGDCEGS